jgi:ankyrin repeat protein
MSPGKRPLGELDVALLDAARMGYTAKIEDALAAGADATAQENYALCQSAYLGNIQAMKLLLKAGADVNACHGRPLLHAAFDGNIEAMTILLEAKADVNATDRYGDTALAAAAQRGHPDAVRLLGAHAHVSERALAVAKAMGHAETVKALIEAGPREIGVKIAVGTAGIAHVERSLAVVAPVARATRVGGENNLAIVRNARAPGVG